jgi:hypothetical protein
MKPTLVIDNEVYHKVMHWVDKSNYEVSGLGTIRVEEGGVLRVTSALLLPQKNGFTHTDIEAEDVNKALFQLRHAAGDLKWWWHSHVKMNVFWSGTDMDTIKKFGLGGWVLATVFNQKREVKSAAWVQGGYQLPWGSAPSFIDDIDTKIAAYDKTKIAEWDEEYRLNVTTAMDMSGWEKTADGAWVKRANPTRPSGTTTTTATGGIDRRPPGMSKREWKRLKRERKYLSAMDPSTTQSLIEDRRAAAIANASDTAASNSVDADDLKDEADEDDTDEYGFTQDERSFLARCGWSDKNVDDLFEEDFTPQDMLLIADSEFTPQAVLDMVKRGIDAELIMSYIEDDELRGAASLGVPRVQ